ncbi:MAG: molybdenum cofactor biosynthesis protein MoaE [Planctomycetota bacterium]
MKLSVILFASLREITGESALELELPDGSRLSELRTRLVQEWPKVGAVPFVFAVNREYAEDERLLAEGDEVALVPAISGGSGEDRFDFAFVSEALDPRMLEERARRDEDGAIVTFLGVTRNHHDGRTVSGLSYQAFEEMALEKALRILVEIGTSAEIGRILVQHRLGEVPIGEASVAVVVSAPHRDAAFDAASRVMDRIKQELPIFKKEFYAEGGPSWVGDLPRV